MSDNLTTMGAEGGNPPLGYPTNRKRIALVGSAPSSVSLAPVGQESWYVVGCSPGAYGHVGPKCDAWFELHRWEPQVAGHVGTGQSWYSPEYVEFLTRFRGPVYMAEPHPPEIANAQSLPIDGLITQFSPYFFTSSLAWMLAMAITTPGVEEIGMWGVDMAANEEYGTQRPGCQFFLVEALRRGIKVTLPPESDLLQPALWYGLCETSPTYIKWLARRRELEQRKASADQRAQQAREESLFLAGALDDLNYMINTWLTTNEFLPPTLNPTGNEVRAKPLGWGKI